MHDYAIQASHITKDYKIFKKNKEKLRVLLFNSKPKVIKHALKDISFEIQRGSKVAFLGNMGSGRTTLIKIISGISFPTSGSINVNGNITSLIDLRAGFDYELTGRENINIKGHFLGWTRKEIKEREEKIISFSEMHDIIDFPMNSYAPGFANRLAFSMFAVIPHDIIIYDCGFNLGSPEFKRKALTYLGELSQDSETTILLVSNESAVVKSICTHAFILDEGRIIFEGTPEESVKLYRKYRNNKLESQESESEALNDLDSEEDLDFEF